MNRISKLLAASFILVPVIALAGGSSGVSASVTTTSLHSAATKLTDATGRPLWLPSAKAPVESMFTPHGRTTFDTVENTGVPGVCTDPMTSAPSLVMLQRTGVCPAPRLMTRYRR